LYTILTSPQRGCKEAAYKQTSTYDIPETDDLLCREAATGQAWISLWLKRKINISELIAENAQRKDFFQYI
jgi:hypothetical protein